MKTLQFISILLILSLLGFSSCRKMDLKQDDAAASKSMADLKINQAFKWETTKIVNVNLTGMKSGVVYINPIEGDYCFNKGFLSSSSGYNTVITIPSYVKEVKLVFNKQTYLVSITGNNLVYGFK